MNQKFLGRTALALSLAAALAASQAQAQSLRVSNLTEPPNRGDPTVSLGPQHTYTYDAIFDSLTTVGSDGKAMPRLAASWTNRDSMTWEFKLRPDTQFHSGTPLNADALVFAVKNMQSDDQRKFGASVYSSIRHIVEATKIDDLTVLVKTDRAAPILPNEITAFRIVDPKAWTELGRDRFGGSPSGTGPFRVTSWAGDATKVEMARFDKGTRAPKVDALTMYFMPEPPTRVQAFQSGAVDLAFGIPSDSLELIKNAGGTINVGKSPGVLALVINQSKGGFTTDKRVRQAFNYALDKSYTETLFRGFAKPSGQPATSTVNGYQPDIAAYPYDPEKAKKLLAEAGYGNGLKVVAEVIASNADNVNLYQTVAQSLGRVGVTMELRIITAADHLAKLNLVKPFEGEVVTMNYGSNPSMDVMRTINAYYNCAAQQKWTCIPEAEDAIKGANSEFDPAKRAAHLRTIAQLYHDAAPTIFLHEQFEVDAVSAKVKNYRNENWRINWHEIELAR